MWFRAAMAVMWGWRKAQRGTGLSGEHEGKRRRPSEHMGPLSEALGFRETGGILCVVHV